MLHFIMPVSGRTNRCPGKPGAAQAVQILLGHTKLESTVRYLGVDAEDALSLSEATEI
jgi:hypothetical protein